MTRKLNLPPTEIAKRRKGNTTSGAARRGFKGGRAPLYSEGTVTCPIALRLSEPEVAIAIWLGKGVAARGIRLALEMASKQIPLPPGVDVLNRFDVADRIEADKRAARLRKLRANAGLTPEAAETLIEAAPAAPIDWDDVDA